jgi:hypothetical protein
MKIYLGIMCFVLGFAACGGNDGGSGIDKNKKISALSDSEVTTFCEWAIAEQGGLGHQTMCGDIVIIVNTQMQCESQYGNFSASCTATVSDAEACVHALADDPCSLGGDTCQTLFDCGGGVARSPYFIRPPRTSNSADPSLR